MSNGSCGTYLKSTRRKTHARQSKFQVCLSWILFSVHLPPTINSTAVVASSYLVSTLTTMWKIALLVCSSLLLSKSSTATATATAKATVHRSLADECQLASSASSSSHLFVFQVDANTPPTQADYDVLERSIELSFPSCLDTVTGAFYDIVNATLQMDLLDNSTATSLYSLPVIINITTNLQEWLEDDESLFSNDDDRRNRRHLEDHCLCSKETLPTESEFLSLLSDTLNTTGSSFAVMDIVEMEEKECLANITTKTNFTSSIGIQVQGNVDLATTEALQILAENALEAFQELYNGIDYCDLTFRKVLSARANVDPQSVVKGDPEDERRRRRVQQHRYLNDETLSNTTEAPSLQPTSSPTSSPTTRGPDLFTIIIELDGTCKGCSSEDDLFVQVQRKLQDQRHQRRHSRQLSTSNGCYCAVGAPEEPPSIEDFWELLLEKQQEDLQGNPTAWNFFDELVSINQVQTFDCTQIPDMFEWTVVAEFSGNFDALTNEEIYVIELTFMISFNNLTLEVCDPFLRFLTNVTTFSANIVSEMPSVAPSATPSVQTNAPDGRLMIRKRHLQDDDATTNATTSPNATTAVASMDPTSSPTESPTLKGADLFFLKFQLTGECNQCQGQVQLFDDVLTRQRHLLPGTYSGVEFRGLRSLVEESVTARAQHQEQQVTLCACPLTLEAGGVPLDDFVNDFAMQIEDSDQLPNVESLQSTTEEVRPTPYPTFAPSEAALAFESSSSSLRPSSSPSVASSLSPSQEPSQSPSLLQSSIPINTIIRSLALFIYILCFYFSLFRQA